MSKTDQIRREMVTNFIPKVLAGIVIEYANVDIEAVVREIIDDLAMVSRINRAYIPLRNGGYWQAYENGAIVACYVVTAEHLTRVLQNRRADTSPFTTDTVDDILEIVHAYNKNPSGMVRTSSFLQKN